MQITCANCGDVCEVPKEILIGLESVDQIEPYICDACENQRDLKADDNDHEMQYGTACTRLALMPDETSTASITRASG